MSAATAEALAVRMPGRAYGALICEPVRVWVKGQPLEPAGDRDYTDLGLDDSDQVLLYRGPDGALYQVAFSAQVTEVAGGAS